MGRRSLLPALLFALAAPARADDAADALRSAAVLADGHAASSARIAAAQTIGDVPPGLRDRVVPRVLDALADADPDVRASAAGALLRIRDERALPRIVKRLGLERDESVVAALLLAAGGLGSSEDASVLLPFASDPSPRVRAAAATALGDVRGSLARERLLALLSDREHDRDWTVGSAAMLALARCGRAEDAGAILVAYRDGGGATQWFARAALARAIASIDADPVPLLDRLVADPDARVATAAASGYVRARREDVLEKRLGDERASVRGACAAAAADAGLARLAPRLLALALRDSDVGVRWTAALALSRLDDPTSDALLAAGTASNDPAVWGSAIAECRRKTGLSLGRDPDAWKDALAARRANLPR